MDVQSHHILSVSRAVACLLCETDIRYVPTWKAIAWLRLSRAGSSVPSSSLSSSSSSLMRGTENQDVRNQNSDVTILVHCVLFIIRFRFFFRNNFPPSSCLALLVHPLIPAVDNSFVIVFCFFFRIFRIMSYYADVTLSLCVLVILGV